jgi:DNA-binding beta-propeller fold protein YncE
MLKRLQHTAALVLLLSLAPTAAALSQPTYVKSSDSVGIPLGLLLDGAGHLYATCESGGGAALRQFDLSGNLLSAFGAGNPYEGYGVERLSDGSIAVADYYGLQVQRFDESGALLSSWPTGGQRAVYLAVDGTDNVYVTDGEGDRVRKFSAQGNLVADWATPHPTGIAFHLGVVYIAGRNNGTVSKYDPSGSPLGSFPTGLVSAEQLSIDASGDVYVADWGGFQLRKFTPTGTVIWTLGSAVPGYSFGPVRYHGVTVATDGTLYAGDYDHRRVLVFSDMPTAAARISWGEIKYRYR